MSGVECSDVAADLSARRRGELSSERANAIEAHARGCDACRRLLAEDDALTVALAKLPKRAARDAFKRSLEERWGSARIGGRDERAKPRSDATSKRARLSMGLAAAAIGAAFAVGGVAILERRAASDAMVSEAINDHLRILYSEHPLEVASGGVHQVKPWFSGRLDFAPVTAFGGDDDFPLQGGSIAYFLDRKAAAYQFKRRLHSITLFVFRADGLSWPIGTVRVGRARASLRTERGFHTMLWTSGDLGYALVSDVDERDLTALAAKIAGE